MANRPPPEDPNAKLVDKLLKDLPYADPEPKPGPKTGPGAGPRRAPVTQGPQVGRARGGDRPGSVGVWARVGLGVALAAAITQWPYSKDCGWALTGYGTAVVVVLAAAAWATVFTWRAHLGIAHVISLGLILFGLGLAGSVVLPRVGYAAQPATWRCGATPPTDAVTPDPDAPAGAVPATPAVPTDSSAVTDSLAQDSVATDSSGTDSTAASPVPPPGRDR